MSAVWCVKCNFCTMILRKAHDNPRWRIREHGNTAREWSKVGFDPLVTSAIRHQAQLSTVAATAPRFQRFYVSELAEPRTAYTALLSDKGVAAIRFQQLVGLDPLICREANELYWVARR